VALAGKAAVCISSYTYGSAFNGYSGTGQAFALIIGNLTGYLSALRKRQEALQERQEEKHTPEK